MKTIFKVFPLNVAVILILLSWGCSKQHRLSIPTDSDGNVLITDISKVTSDGITTLDDEFTVEGYFPNAKEGDVLVAELLKLQTPSNGGSDQLLPLAGTQKEVTVNSSLEASVTYTKEEADMKTSGNFIVITFSGKTASGQLEVEYEKATAVSDPQIDGSSVTITRGAGTAYYEVTSILSSGTSASSVEVRMKNGADEPWVNVGAGSYSLPAQVPISDADFANGKDSMIYSFVVDSGNNSDTVTETLVIQAPTFFIAHSAELSVKEDELGGFDLLKNESTLSGDADAIVTLDNSLEISGGQSWVASGKSISFVPITENAYESNDPTAIISDFNSGTSSSSIDAGIDGSFYAFKIQNGSDPSDVFYGSLKITEIIPETSLQFNYNIGNLYTQLADLK